MHHLFLGHLFSNHKLKITKLVTNTKVSDTMIDILVTTFQKVKAQVTLFSYCDCNTWLIVDPSFVWDNSSVRYGVALELGFYEVSG